jgi:hypothetical protein
MKKIIAFSLFGTSEIYVSGLIQNLARAQEYYPDWTTRIYCEEGTKSSLFGKLSNFNVEFFEMRSTHKNAGLFWRFSPIFDPNVDIFISRDADSRIGYREAGAVSEWITSNRAIHVMRDAHNHSFPILAGMAGFKNTTVHKKYFRKIRHYLGDDMTADQKFLGEVIWPKYKGDALIHDHWANVKPLRSPKNVLGEVQTGEAYGVGVIRFLVKERFVRHASIFPAKNPSRPFPPHNMNDGLMYVGQIFDENDSPVYSQDSRWEYELRGFSFPN